MTSVTPKPPQAQQPDAWRNFLRHEAASRDSIDFKRIYVDMADDLIAGLMLSQIVYWHLPDAAGKSRLRVQRDGHLWLVKGREEWWEECRLTAKQADLALKKLRARGLVETHRWRFNKAPTTHIRIVEARFLELWSQYAPALPQPAPEFDERSSSEFDLSVNSELPQTSNSSYRDYKTETTDRDLKGGRQQQHGAPARAGPPAAAAAPPSDVSDADLDEAKALLREFGINGRPLRSLARLPLDIVRGWCLAFVVEQRARDVGAGLLVSWLQSRDPPEPPFDALGRWTRADWREVITRCWVYAGLDGTLDLAGLPAHVRESFDAWTEHFARWAGYWHPDLEGLPDYFALEAETLATDAWIAAQRATVRAGPEDLGAGDAPGAAAVRVLAGDGSLGTCYTKV